MKTDKTDKMKTKEEILFNRMVTMPDGFHDANGFECQMRDGYGDQIYEAMQEHTDQAIAEYKRKLKEVVLPEDMQFSREI